MDTDATRRPIWKSLYAQVITAIVIGVIIVLAVSFDTFAKSRRRTA